MELEYKYLPATQQLQAKMPTLIFLHGRGTDENDLLGLAPYFDSQFHIYSVRAPFPFEFGGYMWCGIDEQGSVDLNQLRRSRTALKQFIETKVQTNNEIEPSKIFLFGFSLGALMALDVALHSTAPISGIVAHSGLYANTNETFCKKTMPKIFIVHGTHDPVVPVELGRSTFAYLKSQQIPVEYREYPIVHTISDKSLNDCIQWLQKQLQ